MIFSISTRVLALSSCQSYDIYYFDTWITHEGRLKLLLLVPIICFLDYLRTPFAPACPLRLTRPLAPNDLGFFFLKKFFFFFKKNLLCVKESEI
jgi:hypothetical protein